MPPPSKRPVSELIRELNDLAQTAVEQVRHGRSARGALEQTVLRGVAVGVEATQELAFMLESAQGGRKAAEELAEMLEDVERKRIFFQSCTMRRSAAPSGGRDDEAEADAAEAEQLAVRACTSPAIDRLVEAYKATEALEARIAELRGSAKSATGPEPRVLDLPRARVLVARRAIGGAIVELDEDEKE